jgi:hypothetical protein
MIDDCTNHDLYGHCVSIKVEESMQSNNSKWTALEMFVKELDNF